MNILLIGITNPIGSQLVSILSSYNYNIFYLHYREITSFIPEHKNPIRYDFIISVAPIWHLATLLATHKVVFNNIISLSSTSLLTKKDSNLNADKVLVSNFESGEQEITELCSVMGAKRLFLRTTMLWGYGYDQNVSTLIRFCKKFHFIPYFPPSSGSRSPIHYAWLAKAIIRIMHTYDDYEDFLILKGNRSFSLREMLHIIALRNSSIIIPIFVPLSLLAKINTTIRSRFLGKLIGYISRSNLPLDDFEKSEHIYVIDQPAFSDLLNQDVYA